MTNFVLRGTDGTDYVTSDGSERARLLGQGYTEIPPDTPPATDEPATAAAPKPFRGQKPEPINA